MAHKIIDALYCIPKNGAVTQIADCIPFSQDLGPLMESSGIAGAVVAPCRCTLCHHIWNCADRRTQEIRGVVARRPKQLRGLACYDSLRIGDSLRWIDEAVGESTVVGGYIQAENSVSGLSAPRMYPLYGLCAKHRLPIVIDFASANSWAHQRSQVESVAADFPELNILLAVPQGSDAEILMQWMERIPHIFFFLSPQDLQQDPALCEYVELQGRERVLFRSSLDGWTLSVEATLGLSLSPAAQRAYLSENATTLFGFQVVSEDLAGK